MSQAVTTESFVLASLVSSYPGPEFGTHLTTLLNDELVQVPGLLKEKLREFAGDADQIDGLRSTYIEIFDHSKSLNPLYETEYGRERLMFKANELSDIAAFYRAFGFELDAEGQKEMLDHISVEIEFYSLLKMKLSYLEEIQDRNGVEIVRDGMGKFLKDHLGRFSSAICERPGVLANNLYSQVFAWIDSLILEECKALGIEPERVKWLSSDKVEDNVCCGGTISLNK